MIRRILVGVDDSPAALAAARTAIDLAIATQADVRVVHVLANHQLTDLLRGTGTVTGTHDATVTTRRGAGGDSLLRHVEQLAHRAGIAVDASVLEGEPAQTILAQARSWQADLIVLGRSDRAGPGEPYIGYETRHVLEFASQPVLVVPASTG